MRFLTNLLIPCALFSACWATSVDAFDISTQNTVVTVWATGMVSSAPFDRKLIIAAHDDAAAFVASDGELRGAQLESALHYLRKSRPKLHVSDLELAQAILVQ
ncbi:MULTISPECIES: DUF2388 domain-containing protein [Pseudomonas]|uniref:DUF2388 domain-containing protein n=1 Tax=Pseudomonas TaxID=286 RepID=UPI000D2132C5|nr:MULTISPECIES: DUF2388 domain-containing protein [Pseudomonas]AVX86885.1 Holliday junction resolvase [Pseudomonas koreensis]MBI6949503.1 DUF2388 domain-containing protein [Pseudomonas koreensis]MCU7217704.1 DUF2388 domain-containing protein [Pseudomonas sp. VE 196-7]